LLECRESAAAKNNAFGDWQTVLNAPVELMPNDQVVLKTAVLDTTKATSGTITLENPVSATISGFPYVVNYHPEDKDYASGSATLSDFRRYYAAQLNARPDGGAGYKIMTNIIITKKSFETVGQCTVLATFTGPPVPLNNTIVNAVAPGVHSGTNLTFVGSESERNEALNVSGGRVFIKSSKAEPDIVFTFAGTIDGSGSNAVPAGTLKAGIPYWMPNTFTSITSIEVSGGTQGSTATVGTITVGTLSAPVQNATSHISVGPFNTGPEIMSVPCSVHVANSVEPKDVVISGIPRTEYFKVKTVVLSEAPSSDNYFEPLELSHTIAIPAGTYTPDALCTFINSSIVRNSAESTSGIDLLVNDMMKTSKYLGNEEVLFMVREDDNASPEVFAFNTNDANGSWIGCSTVQIGVNSSTNCFEWQYLHTPYYDSQNGAASTGSPAILYEQRSTTYFSTSAMMGIALASLSPSTFWEGQLGFGEAFATYTHGSTPRTVGSFANTRFPTFNVAVGANTTTQFVGTDSVVVKKTLPGTVPSLPANTHANNRLQLVDTANLDDFIPVTAPTPYTTLAKDSTGYFLIDVQSNFKTEVLGSAATSRTIQAIVGRFYNTGSYTISGSDSGVVYTHLGAPMMIQSMNIRVLHPDGTLADDIGNDSTLYFEIQRAASN
jgi:hypothetical protein